MKFVTEFAGITCLTMLAVAGVIIGLGYARQCANIFETCNPWWGVTVMALSFIAGMSALGWFVSFCARLFHQEARQT